jgi:hypothetical protein
MYPTPRSFRPTRRDIFVACLSAACALLWFKTTQLDHFRTARDNIGPSSRAPTNVKPDQDHQDPHLDRPRILLNSLDRLAQPVVGNKPSELMPTTTVLAHHDGWTLFENLYMFNGTLLIVSDEEWTLFPDRRLMTSTGKPENHASDICHIIEWHHASLGLPALNEPGNTEGTLARLNL